MKQMIPGAVVALVLSAAVTSSRAAVSDDEAIRQIKDRAEIDALMWRYVRALDTNNADAYAAAYTPDGQFGSGPNATKGHDALKKNHHASVLGPWFFVRGPSFGPSSVRVVRGPVIRDVLGLHHRLADRVLGT